MFAADSSYQFVTKDSFRLGVATFSAHESSPKVRKIQADCEVAFIRSHAKRTACQFTGIKNLSLPDKYPSHLSILGAHYLPQLGRVLITSCGNETAEHVLCEKPCDRCYKPSEAAHSCSKPVTKVEAGPKISENGRSFLEKPSEAPKKNRKRLPRFRKMFEKIAAKSARHRISYHPAAVRANGTARKDCIQSAIGVCGSARSACGQSQEVPSRRSPAQTPASHRRVRGETDAHFHTFSSPPILRPPRAYTHALV